MSSFTQEDLAALAGELQLEIDDSVFIGEAYVADDAPDTIYVHMTGEVLDEPGAQGIFPFYADKHWLTEKVRMFTENALNATLDQWGCGDVSYDSLIELDNVRDDEECSLLIAFSF